MNTTIQLKQLTVSPANVRVLSAHKAQDKELISGIKSMGVLQNLVVVPTKKNQYEVVAGGRRLAALKTLLKDKAIDDDYPVPCLVKDKKTNVTELSLAENIQRVAMHPADQFIAFSKLIDEGQSTSDIAQRFGVSKKTVEKRLALGRVAPKLMEYYRKDKINLDSLMAFTITNDHERQLACYKELNSNHRLWEHEIRRWLMGESITTHKGLGKFVGKAAYVKAGGAVSNDLFQETTYLLDTALVTELAEKKLQKEADKLKKEGWKWVELDAHDNCDTEKYVRLQPQLQGVPTKISKAIDDLIEESKKREQDAEIRGFNDNEEDELDLLYDNIYTLECERDEKYLGFTKQQKAYSGCVVTIDFHGTLSILYGLALPEDVPQPKNSSDDNTNETTAGIEGNPQQKTVSQALTNDLQVYRQEAVKAVLLTDSKAAKDVLNYSLCLQMLSQNSWTSSTLINSSFSPVDANTSLDDIKQYKAHQEIQEARNALNTEWLAIEDKGEQFKAFRALSEDEKDKLMTFCVAESLTIDVRGSEPAQEALIEQIVVPFAEYWRPTKDNYFKRLSKDQLFSQFESIRSKDWVDIHDDMKKSHVVESMENWFAIEPDNAEDPRITWLPEQF